MLKLEIFCFFEKNAVGVLKTIFGYLFTFVDLESINIGIIMTKFVNLLTRKKIKRFKQRLKLTNLLSIRKFSFA